MKRLIVPAFLLWISLPIYLFYRTEATVINGLAIAGLGKNFYHHLRSVVRQHFPLPAFVVFSLPEMLWTAAFTLLAGGLYVRVFGKNISCIWMPLLIATGLELLQRISDFPGHFDWLDFLGAMVAWALAALLVSGDRSPVHNLFGRLNRQSIAFMACYVLMFLAHVWR